MLQRREGWEADPLSERELHRAAGHIGWIPDTVQHVLFSSKQVA